VFRSYFYLISQKIVTLTLKRTSVIKRLKSPVGGRHLTPVLVVLAVLLHQGAGHPVQELLGEARGVGAARGVDHLLAAMEVALEAAAQHLDIVLLILRGRDLSLIERLDPKLVNVNTGLVLSLGIPHAPCVFEVLGLVLPSLAQVHDDLRGAGVQGVEVGPVILVQALGGEVIDTPQPVHQLRAHFIQLVFGSGKTQVLVVCYHLEGVCALGHGVCAALVTRYTRN